MLYSHICAHNHSHTPHDIIAEATQFCASRGLRLTDQRRQILVLLAEAAQPLGAYDLLEKIQQASSQSQPLKSQSLKPQSLKIQPQKRLAPVIVYRALDFLLEAKLIHRLESRNAFIICPHRHSHDETIVFMICEACGRAEEAQSSLVHDSLEQLAQTRSFQLKSKVIELSGICKLCSESTVA